TIENYYNELIAEINKEMRVKTPVLSEQDVNSTKPQNSMAASIHEIFFFILLFVLLIMVNSIEVMIHLLQSSSQTLRLV
ncbi:MAG: hypothetical protein ACSW8D_12160, partial [Prevotella sp.]